LSRATYATAGNPRRPGGRRESRRLASNPTDSDSDFDFDSDFDSDFDFDLDNAPMRERQRPMKTSFRSLASIAATAVFCLALVPAPLASAAAKARWSYVGAEAFTVDGKRSVVPTYVNSNSIEGDRSGAFTVTFQARYPSRRAINRINVGVVVDCNAGDAVADQFLVYYSPGSKNVARTEGGEISERVRSRALSFCRADDRPALLSLRDEIFENSSSCVFTIRYQPRTSHEVRWRGNECGELLTDFLSVAELQKAGKLKRVTSATRNRLAGNHSRGVFYVEGEFTASIYPEGPLGIPYEISVGD
jgi:hypothetical protein